MGLHQKITDQNTSEPCDCGADDDHGVEQPLIDEGSDSANEAQRTAEESFREVAFQEPVWTDGSE